MNKNLLKNKMRKHYVLFAAALVAGLWTVPASAAEQYLSGNVGMTWLNDIPDGSSRFVLDDGTGLLVAVGLDNKHQDYRFEGEVGYQTSGINSRTNGFGSTDYRGNVHVWSLMANGYYDIYSTNEGFRPYLTAGAGAVRVKFDDLRYAGASQGSGNSEHESAFAYQIGAGVAFPITPDMKFDARYRFFSTADFRLDDGYKTHYSSSSFLIGLRFRL